MLVDIPLSNACESFGLDLKPYLFPFVSLYISLGGDFRAAVVVV